MKRYVAEFENDFERAYELAKKRYGDKVTEELLNRAIRTRNNYISGLITAREAVSEIVNLWYELDCIY